MRAYLLSPLLCSWILIANSKLLKKLSYTTTTDTLIHTGDIIAKSPLAGSLATLDLMTKSNITGVRGNHDQMVIGWRGWIERVLSHPKGKKWLEKQEKKGKKKALKYLKGLMQVDDLEHAESDWKRVPDEWEFLGDHYRIARAMTDEQAKYLRSLPLILHIPRLHGFVVHAGLLPLDPNRSATNLRQPLAHVPVMDVSLVEDDEAVQKAKLLKMRTRQEGAVLEDIPQNTDPWVLLNMRSLLNDNSISRYGTQTASLHFKTYAVLPEIQRKAPHGLHYGTLSLLAVEASTMRLNSRPIEWHVKRTMTTMN